MGCDGNTMRRIMIGTESLPTLIPQQMAGWCRPLVWPMLIRYTQRVFRLLPHLQWVTPKTAWWIPESLTSIRELALQLSRSTTTKRSFERHTEFMAIQYM